MKIYILYLYGIYLFKNILVMFDNVYLRNKELLKLCFNGLKGCLRKLYEDPRVQTFIISTDSNDERRVYLIIITNNDIYVYFCKDPTNCSIFDIQKHYYNFGMKPTLDNYKDVVSFIAKILEGLHDEFDIIEGYFSFEGHYSSKEEFDEIIYFLTREFSNLPKENYMIKRIERDFKRYIYGRRFQKGGDSTWISLEIGDLKLLTHINMDFGDKIESNLLNIIKQYEDGRIKEIIKKYKIKRGVSKEYKFNIYMLALFTEHYEYIKTHTTTEQMNLSSKNTMIFLFRFITNKNQFKEYFIDKILENDLSKSKIIRFLYETLRMFKTKTWYKYVKEGKEDIEIYENIMLIRKYAKYSDFKYLYTVIFRVINCLVVDLDDLSVLVMSKDNFYKKKYLIYDKFMSKRISELKILSKLLLKVFFEYTETNEILDDQEINRASLEKTDFQILKNLCFESSKDFIESSCSNFPQSFVNMLEILDQKER
ncbi:hypothetical protein NGRA_3012 [Nosema granulosis]|uniref:Uncharacterized protein n=1 Tax=Nosema granulosis TaxID=83296 RepID=A0A9P6KX60_9MICR|nr:hypothetical protein NGRA_3012 [Nosema granulosis]